MKKLIITVGSMLSAAMLSAVAPSDYAKYVKITPSSSAVPASGALENFPALVRISTDIAGFSYGDFQQADHSDLTIVDESGTELPYEIDTWNASGESLVWVLIPRLTASTELTLYYGSARTTSQQPAAVWSGYTGVWHCSDASGNLTDSTGNGLVAVPSGNSTQKMIAYEDGAIGSSRYNQDNCTYYAGGAYIGGHIVSNGWQATLSGGSSFTISGWFKGEQVVGWVRAFSCKATDVGDTGFEAVFEDDPRRIFFVTKGQSGFRADCPNVVGNWINVTYVVDGTSAACYTNGYLSASTESLTAVTWPTEEGLGLGVNPLCKQAGLFGRIDEFRLTPSVLGADEIAAAYRTAADHAFFDYSSAREVTVPIDVSGFAKSVTFTLGSDVPTVNAAQVVLVRLSEAIEGFSYGDFTSATGADMVFTDASGCALAHEIDTWDTAGESLVWVRLDSCRAGDTVRMCYGKSGYVPTSSTETWKNYVGVWHFRETGGTAYDSGAGHYDGTPAGARADYNIGVRGVVGMARQNGGNGANSETDRAYLSLTTTGALTLGTKFTVSGFFYVTGHGGWYRFVSRRASSGGWGQELLWSDASTMYVYGASDSVAVTIPSPEKNWVYLTLCYDDKTCAVYANGELVTNATLPSAPTDNGQTISFGNTPTGGDWSLFGNYDEIRISSGTPSAQSIAADYATMTRSDFLTAGPAQPIDPSQLDCSLPVVRRASAGGFEGVFTVKSGTGTFAADYGTGTLQDLPDITCESGEKTFAISSSLAADESFPCTVVGTGTTGNAYRFSAVDAFYNGSLTVEKVADADELHTQAGTFRISRGDTEAAMRYALRVNYALSGTAVAGVNYEGASTGSVVIPAGEASVDLEIRPLVVPASAGDTTVTVTLTDGAYLAGAHDAATLTIRKLPAPRKRNFAKCVELTISAAFLGEEEDLADFPVLVRLSTAITGFTYADFKTTDGSDMVFTDKSFAAMPHSVDEWHTDGTSLVWVCVPHLRRNTKIYLYYGSGDDIAGVDAGRPWKNYVGVWHFNENAHTVPARDYSGNGLDAVPGATHYVSGSRDYENGGQIGHARWNQPAVHVDFGKNWYDVPNYDHLNVGNTFLFSGWFIGGNKMAGYPRLFSRKTAYDSVNGWEVELSNSFAALSARGAGASSVGATVPDIANGWTHLAFQYTRNKDRVNDLSVYANGVLVATGTVGLGLDNGMPLAFGCDADHNEASFFGAFDELRLRRGNDGASWVKAEYQTASDPEFVTYGSVRQASCGLMLIVR